MDDLYEVLQVHPRAESDVVRAAYRALARRHHPDMGGDERRMMELNAAWAVLGDPRLRSAYDIERDRPSPPPATAAPADRNGNPDAPPRRSNDSSRTMDFGRYAGWSLEQLLERDPDYLKWLARTSIGRGFTAEIEALLAIDAARDAARTAARPAPRQSRWWTMKGGDRRDGASAPAGQRRPVRS